MTPSTLTPPRRAPNRFVLVNGHEPEGRPSASAISVLLVHGEALVRGGLRALLEQQRDIRVTDEDHRRVLAVIAFLDAR